jgi:competence ComEA-like helix-hairpin-helix protein
LLLEYHLQQASIVEVVPDMSYPASPQPNRPRPSREPDWRTWAEHQADQEPSPLPAFPYDAERSYAELPDDPFPPETIIESHPAPLVRVKPRRKLARVIAPILALLLLAGMVIVLRLPDTSSQPQPTILRPTDEIQAYIVGAVAHPGVYPLHNGDRVDKLLQEAGGAAPDADLARINLAAYVSDGEEVYVPKVGETFPTGLDNGGPGKVNINTASAEDMHTLLGISLTTANKIVAYRQAHGPYTAITQLLNVMSRTTYDKIKDRVTV